VSAPSWEEYLRSLAVFGMRPGLERVEALLDMVDRPQASFRAVHIVGTNGKSSTTRYVQSLLSAHGVRAGAYLSPHITGFAERVMIEGRAIDETSMGAAVEDVSSLVGRLPAALGETTQFEVLTVAAFIALAREGVAAAAIEAGLGGRLDATNVLHAPVVVLTNIGLEHTEVLGDTREQIFAEKAAVIGVADAVFGELDGLEDLARRVCSDAGARPHFLGSDFTIQGRPEGFAVTRQTGERWAGLSVPTPAPYQVVNASLAVIAVRLLLGRLDLARTRRALSGTVVPGRLQKVGDQPLMLADGAHNPDGLRALIRSLSALTISHPVVGVLSIMRDKSYGEMLELLAPILDAVVCTRASEPRSLTAEELAVALRVAATRVRHSDLQVLVEPNPHAALETGRRLAGPDGCVLVAGSLYLLEDLRDLFGRMVT
jgi:dihydrofolate synthase/folylpolyglutamate synthase